MQALSAAQGGDTGEDAVIGKGGFEIAALSAGGAIAAVDAVMAGRVTNACTSPNCIINDSSQVYCDTLDLTLY
jgi:acetoin utilization deacetylase AcuC-like enzyme